MKWEVLLNTNVPDGYAVKKSRVEILDADDCVIRDGKLVFYNYTPDSLKSNTKVVAMYSDSIWKRVKRI